MSALSLPAPAFHWTILLIFNPVWQTSKAQAAGQQTIEWDGLDNEGEPVSPGVYQFAVNPLNAEGATVSVITFLRESVKSAVWENGQTELILASGKSLSTDDVLSVF